jgi:hypothetical protein
MRKLAIVGTNKRTRDNAPWSDLDYDIWVFNEAAQQEWCKRWTGLLQLHNKDVYRSEKNWVVSDHWQWLQKKHNRPIWMQDMDVDVPDSQKYPLDEVLKTLPGLNMKWLQPPENPYEERKGWIDSTGAYALSLAVYLGYDHIEVYGFDLESSTEYSYQLGNWRFLVGIVLGMGIDLVLKCSVNDFGYGRLYAYDGEIQIGKDYFESRYVDLEQNWKRADAAFDRARDRLAQGILDRKFDKIPQLVIDCQNAGVESGQLGGALEDCKKYAERTDMISRQEFELRSAKALQEAETARATVYNAGGKAEYVYNVWRTHGTYEALQQLRLLLQEQMKLAYKMGAMFGIHQENLEYITEYDVRLTAAGGVRTLHALSPEGVNNDHKN